MHPTRRNLSVVGGIERGSAIPHSLPPRPAGRIGGVGRHLCGHCSTDGTLGRCGGCNRTAHQGAGSAATLHGDRPAAVHYETGEAAVLMDADRSTPRMIKDFVVR